MKLIVVWLLLLSTVASVLANQSASADEEKLSSTEEQEVRRFAKQFDATIRKTRDLTPYFSKPPASTLLLKALTDREDPIRFVADGVAASVGEDQLMRFYAAVWNVMCLRESYLHGKFVLNETAIRDLSTAQEYPPNVIRFMKHNPTLNDWWHKLESSSTSEKTVKTVTQFNSLFVAYNRVSVLMRQYLNSHPPEQTAIFKRNQVLLEQTLKEIFVNRCNTEKECAGFPLHTRFISVYTPVLQLMLVRLNGRLQIVAVGVNDD